MKKIHLIILLSGLLALSMIGLSACDDMTGVSDKTANQSISSQAIQGVVNAEGVTEYDVAGVFIDEIEDQIYTGSTIEVDITGYVGFYTDTERQGQPQPRLLSLHLEVNKAGEFDEDENPIWKPISSFQVGGNDALVSQTLVDRDGKPGREFEDEDVFNGKPVWKIDDIGTYTLRATADFTGSDEEEGTETVVVEFPLGDVEFPAAPAIAARILEANNITPRYGQGRSGGNYISDVAQHMGPGTDFSGEPKELIDEDGKKDMNQDYWDAVRTFLQADTGDPLNEKPEGYRWEWEEVLED